jgi:hypothetical protein
MMTRTQITLEPEMQRKVRRRAGEMGVSMAEYVRRLLERDLAAPQLRVDPSVVFDLGRSAGSDIARNKDAMLGEAFASSRRRPRR